MIGNSHRMRPEQTQPDARALEDQVLGSQISRSRNLG